MSTSALVSFHRADNLNNVKKSLNEVLSILSIHNMKLQKEIFSVQRQEKSFVKAGKFTAKLNFYLFQGQLSRKIHPFQRNNPQYVVEIVDQIYNYLQLRLFD